jgi:hypothetical protein
VLLRSDLRKKNAPPSIARATLLAVAVPEGTEVPGLFIPEVPLPPPRISGLLRNWGRGRTFGRPGHLMPEGVNFRAHFCKMTRMVLSR